MLLEVQNISKAAVVLGNTWIVNAVIISGVMVMILLREPDRGPVPAAADEAGLWTAGRELPGAVPPRSLDVRVPSIPDQGARGRAADEFADALQRDCVHPLVRGGASERTRRLERT